jgi:hypothetical protein
MCTGPLQWSKGLGGATDEEGNFVAIDPSGNILLGGYFTSPIDAGCGMMIPGGGDTPFLIKYSAAGACIWSKAFPISQVGTTDQVKGVTTDALGNIYISGTFFGGVDLGGGMMVATGTSDVFLAKFKPNGAFVWGKRFGNASPQTGKALSVDAQGNVFLVGDFYGQVDFGGGSMVSVGNTDIYAAKFDTNGNYLWAKRFGDVAGQTAAAVAVDSAGNMVFTGTLNGAADFGGGLLTSAGLGDVFVAKLDGAGNHLWSKSFGDAADQLGTGIAVNALDDVIVTGYAAGATLSFGGPNLVNQGGDDAFLVQLDPAGNHLWSRLFGGPGNQRGLGVAVDPAGNVVMTGLLASTADFGGGVLTSAGLADIVVARYDSTGAHLWSKIFGDPAYQFARSVAAAPNGDSIVAGLSLGPVDFGGGPVAGAGGEDIFLVRFGP